MTNAQKELVKPFGEFSLEDQDSILRGVKNDIWALLDFFDNRKVPNRVAAIEGHVFVHLMSSVIQGKPSPSDDELNRMVRELWDTYLAGKIQ